MVIKDDQALGWTSRGWLARGRVRDHETVHALQESQSLSGGMFRLPASWPVTGFPRQRSSGFLPSLFHRFHSFKNDGAGFHRSL